MASDTECCHTLHLVGDIEIGNRNDPKPGRHVRSSLSLDGQHLLSVGTVINGISVSLLLFVLTSTESLQTNLRNRSEQLEPRHRYVP